MCVPQCVVAMLLHSTTEPKKCHLSLSCWVCCIMPYLGERKSTLRWTPSLTFSSMLPLWPLRLTCLESGRVRNLSVQKRAPKQVAHAGESQAIVSSSQSSFTSNRSSCSEWFSLSTAIRILCNFQAYLSPCSSSVNLQRLPSGFSGAVSLSPHHTILH